MSAPTSLLVTGAEGFVGRRLCAALAERWPQARRSALVFDHRRPVEGWENRPVDLTDAAAAHAGVAQAAPDLVVHLAGQASAAQAARAAAAAWRVNVGGSLNLAMAVAAASPRATFLFVSSADAYGASLRDGPANEATPLKPLNVYARTKAAAEAMLADVLPKTVRLIVARPFNHTGPGQDERFVIPAFAAQIARAEAGAQAPVIRVGALDGRLDFLDVRDVIDAYLRLIEGAERLPARSVFNIATGAPIAVREALDSLLAMARVPIAVEVEASRLRRIEIPVASGDYGRLAAATGWKPVHPLAETLRNVLDHFRAIG